jgi:callose synthase
MFDPADLPPRLSEYANMVYSACEDLGNFFGFQDASVRNQAEHLLILLSNHRRYMNSHILPPALQPPSPIHALHAKVFSNYMKWCRYQGVPPNFSKMSSSTAGMAAPPSVASRVVDLVLFFCVWGEACNIRHMPECLWFLYHKMMEEYTLEQDQRSLYAGHFLDCVVTPIFKILSEVSTLLCVISACLIFMMCIHFLLYLTCLCSSYFPPIPPHPLSSLRRT